MGMGIGGIDGFGGFGSISTVCGRNSGRQVTVLRNADGTEAGRITRTSGSCGNNGKKPKKIMYDFKQVSARILQVKTSGNAGQTVIMARSKLAALRQKVKSGEYDEEELAAAIIHAEKMVRIAKKKQNHLKAEENAANGMNTQAVFSEDSEEKNFYEEGQTCGEDCAAGDSGMSREEMERRLERLEQQMEETMRAAEELDGMDELSEELMDAETQIDPADLEQRKRKHRMDEQREIIEADMKYLKALFDKLEREKQSTSSGTQNSGGSYDTGGFGGPDAVSLDIVSAEMPMSGADTALPTGGGNLDISI